MIKIIPTNTGITNATYDKILCIKVGQNCTYHKRTTSDKTWEEIALTEYNTLLAAG